MLAVWVGLAWVVCFVWKVTVRGIRVGRLHGVTLGEALVLVTLPVRMGVMKFVSVVHSFFSRFKLVEGVLFFDG